MIRQRLTGLAAVLLLATALVGIPLGLLTLDQQLAIRDTGGNGIWDTLTRPDDGTALLTALFLVGWVAWLVFALTIVLEVLSRLRGVQTPRIPTLRLPQQSAAALVGAAALLFTIAPAAQLTPPTHANPHHPLAEQHDTSRHARGIAVARCPHTHVPGKPRGHTRGYADENLRGRTGRRWPRNRRPHPRTSSNRAIPCGRSPNTNSETGHAGMRSQISTPP